MSAEGSVVQEAPLLRMRGIEKSFVGVKVLHGVDLECRAGEVHAVMGENGAGKSTLMKVLAGAYAPDAGEILLDGEPVSFRHAREAQEKGVSIIYQEFNLLPARTVAQTVSLGRNPHRGPLGDRRKMEEDTAALLRTLDAEEQIRPGTLVGDLPVSQQQTVEIAKALSFDARVLVMDEPTAALSAAEADILFGRVRALRERGLAVIYISHRLREVFELADRITVLKDGRKVGTVAAGEVGPRELVRMMVGRDLDHYYPPRAEPGDIGDVRLRVRGGSVGILRNVDLEVRAGEVVGLAGLQGSGRTEFARAVFGVE